MKKQIQISVDDANTTAKAFAVEAGKITLTLKMKHTRRMQDNKQSSN